jgi:RNA polymerase sigma factor (TIGR02999 family)
MGEITTLLALWRAGDTDALHRLTPLVYEQLRRVALSYVRYQNPSHSIQQPTELINELFVDLLRLRRVELTDRQHFFALSARVMRQILIKHARARAAGKRGGDSGGSNGRIENLPLDEELDWSGFYSKTASLPGNLDVLDLNAAMDELEAYDEAVLRTVELRYFFGLTAEETAETLELSKATVDRHIRFALSWLHSRLHPSPQQRPAP